MGEIARREDPCQLPKRFEIAGEFSQCHVGMVPVFELKNLTEVLRHAQSALALIRKHKLTLSRRQTELKDLIRGGFVNSMPKRAVS